MVIDWFSEGKEEEKADTAGKAKVARRSQGQEEAESPG